MVIRHGHSRLGILKDFTFIVSYHDLLLVVIENVTGVNGHLATATWCIDDVLGNGITGGMSTEAFDNLNALGDTRSEVRRPLDQIALIEIIGTNSAKQKLMNEFAHCLNIVIDPCKQHALVPKRNSVVGKTPQSLANFERQLPRVVDMHAHPERMIFLQHLAELRGDALGKKDRHTSSNADKLDMRNRSHPAYQIPQFLVRKKERVASGKEDVAHFDVLLKIGECLVEIRVQFLFAGAAHHPAAGAITAVGSASVGHKEKDPVRISVHQAGDGHMAILSTRIGHLPRRRVSLLHAWDHLPANGAIGIIRLDEIEEVRCDGKRELASCEQGPCPLRGSHGDEVLEFPKRGNAVLQLPFPVVPFLCGNVRPISGRMGNETNPRGFQFLRHRAGLDAKWESVTVN